MLCRGLSRNQPQSGSRSASRNERSSHVRRVKLQAQKILCLILSGRSAWPPLGRAGGTIIKTTVDQALMRGLVTAGPLIRRGAASVYGPASEVRL
jgi:hypothetical protein